MKKILYLLLGILGYLGSVNMYAQDFVCDMPTPDDTSLKGRAAQNPHGVKWEEYDGYDCTDTPIRVLRVTFHVLQHSTDKSRSFQQDNAEDMEYLNETLINWLNYNVANNPVMDQEPELADHHEDVRIRFEKVGLFFWKEDDYDNKYKDSKVIINKVYNGKIYEYFNDYLYDKYVKDKTSVKYKDNSLHVFFCSDIATDGKIRDAGGHGKYYGLPIIMENIHYEYPLTIVLHEIGHNLGLYHSYGNFNDSTGVYEGTDDHCFDTPPTKPCWDLANCGGETPSNNVMGYSGMQKAFTQCQINIVHFVLNSDYPVSKALVNKAIPPQSNVIFKTVSNLICQNREGRYELALPFGTTVEWSKVSSANNLALRPHKQYCIARVTSDVWYTGNIICDLGFGTNPIQFKIPIWINDPGSTRNMKLSGSLKGNAKGKSLVTNSTTKLAAKQNVFWLYKDSVVINPDFETELGYDFEIKLEDPPCP